MDNVQKINEIMVNLFNTVLKLEERALKSSSNHDLSITEIHTLEAIGTGSSKTMTQVASLLRINVSTLTTAINKLVKKGYVTRVRSEQDKRIVKIALTEDGKNAVIEHEGFHYEMISAAISKLNEEETESFIQSIDNINDFIVKQHNPPIKDEDSFKLEPIELGQHKVPFPIFQGGMSIGISMGKLATEVARNGGVGMIGSFQIGYLEEDYLENPLKANIRVLQREIKESLKELKRCKNPGLIGANIMTMDKDFNAMVKAAVEAGAQVIVAGGGLPFTLPKLVKNTNVAIIPVVSSVRAAKVIINNWQKKYDRTPDGIIFEGPLAGAHLGFKEDMVESAIQESNKAILEMKKLISDTCSKCNLIVAGGIRDLKTGKKAFAYGADALELGSIFALSKESSMNQKVKDIFSKGKEFKTKVLSTPTGLPARVLVNKAVLAGVGNTIGKPKSCDNCLTACPGMEAEFCLKEALIRSGKGETAESLIFIGEGISSKNYMQPVKKIMEQFI